MAPTNLTIRLGETDLIAMGRQHIQLVAESFGSRCALANMCLWRTGPVGVTKYCLLGFPNAYGPEAVHYGSWALHFNSKSGR